MNQHLRELICHSLEQYGAIHNLLLSMDADIGTASSERLIAMNNQLSELHLECQIVDQQIKDITTQTVLLDKDVEELFNKRTSLIHAISLLNQQIAIKAKNVKSLLGHEISTLKAGHSALSGYRQQQDYQGKIVNSSF